MVKNKLQGYNRSKVDPRCLLEAKAVQLEPSVVIPPMGQDSISRIDNYQSSLTFAENISKVVKLKLRIY